MSGLNADPGMSLDLGEEWEMEGYNLNVVIQHPFFVNLKQLF